MKKKYNTGDTVLVSMRLPRPLYRKLKALAPRDKPLTQKVVKAIGLYLGETMGNIK